MTFVHILQRAASDNRPIDKVGATLCGRDCAGDLALDGRHTTLGGFIHAASPLLKSGARVAAPMVGTAIGGPLGGLAGKLLLQMLKEGEFEGAYELEREFELVMGSPEAVHEMIHQIAHHELAYNEALAEMIAEALAEMIAEAAAHEQHEAEAEAMAAVAALTTISPEDERALRSILPHLVSGVAILTRTLRQDPTSRPAVRVIPTVTRRVVRTLKRRAKSRHSGDTAVRRPSRHDGGWPPDEQSGGVRHGDGEQPLRDARPAEILRSSTAGQPFKWCSP